MLASNRSLSSPRVIQRCAVGLVCLLHGWGVRIGSRTWKASDSIKNERLRIAYSLKQRNIRDTSEQVVVDDVDCEADRRRARSKTHYGSKRQASGTPKNQEFDIATPRTNAIGIAKRTPEAVRLAKIGREGARWQRQLNQPLCDCRFSIVIISCHPSFFITKIRLR